MPRGSRVGTVAPTTGYGIVLPETDNRSVRITDRFWIGGQVYEGWDQVPVEYKVPAGSAADVGPPNNAAISLKFRF